MPGQDSSALSLEELKSEILRRQRALPRLLARREAFDKLIAGLRALSDVRMARKRFNKKNRKNLAERAQARMEAGVPAGLPARADKSATAGKPDGAGKLAELSGRERNGSLAEQILLGERNRLRTALGVFRDRPALRLSDENDGGRSAPGGDLEDPGNGNGGECAALFPDQAGIKLHLAGQNRPAPGTPGADEAAPQARSPEEKPKLRVLRAATFEDALLPHMK